MENNIFNFIAETPYVWGYSRSIIYDLPRRDYYMIPNSLYEIINKYDGKVFELINEEYCEYKKTIEEYFSFLEENELYFTSSKEESKFFPKLNMHWDYPAKISNCIIKINNTKIIEVKNILEQLFDLGCYYVQFFVSKGLTLAHLDRILEHLRYSPAELIDIFIDNSTNYKIIDVVSIVNRHKRIKLFYLFNSQSDGYIEKDESDKGRRIIYQSKQNLCFETSCGKVNHNYFNTNIDLFSESQHYNTCLNRKICIDADGEIKNCPAMCRSFGNIKDTTLQEAIEKPGFKDLWGIRKDDIDVCKDCEFRYMCTDCRAFIKDPANFYSQPAKCPYNPYIAKWEGEDGYITVEQWRSENPKWEKNAKRKPLVKNPQPVE